MCSIRLHWRHCSAHLPVVIALVLFVMSRESTAFTSTTRTTWGILPKSSSPSASRVLLRLKDSRQLITDISFQDDSSSSPDRDKEEQQSVQDAKGATVSVGNVVRVCVPNLQAHQIQSNFYGSFDPNTKEFIAVVVNDDDDNSSDELSSGSSPKALILPVGLRGEVTKVYTAANLSANFPIQVKFTPGQHVGEEGYDAPSAFVMHFASNEVEVV